MNAGTLLVDFAPDHHIDDLKSVLIKHKNQFAVLLFSNHFNSMKFLVPHSVSLKEIWKLFLTSYFTIKSMFYLTLLITF